MWFENVGTFVEFGFQHIIPQGLDHVLFVIALYLNARSWPSLFLQVTTFTLAHTITLGLAAAGFIASPGAVIEPLIALSIVVLALEAMLAPKAAAWRLSRPRKIQFYTLNSFLVFPARPCQMNWPRS